MDSLEAEMETCQSDVHAFTFHEVHIHETYMDLLFCALGNTLVELRNAF